MSNPFDSTPSFPSQRFGKLPIAANKSARPTLMPDDLSLAGSVATNNLPDQPSITFAGVSPEVGAMATGLQAAGRIETAMRSFPSPEKFDRELDAIRHQVQGEMPIRFGRAVQTTLEEEVAANIWLDRHAGSVGFSMNA
jgi:hypothetical protein